MRIIDIREKNEFNKYHIPNSLNMPFSNFKPLANQFFSKHKKNDVLLICRSGRRAIEALDLLLEWDLAEEKYVHIFYGGLLRWVQEGKKIVKNNSHNN